MKRQQARNLLLFLSLLLFPVTLYYFSPYLIVNAALSRIINGSFIVFVLLFLGSLFLGRVFCGYLCPSGALQECAIHINGRSPKQGARNYIKYGIWLVWVGAIVFCFWSSDQVMVVDFFYQTEHGISVSNIYVYIIYYTVVLLMFVPSVLFGKRVACHYICWMAPFMVMGDRIRHKLHLPGLYIVPETSKCVSCRQCNKVCPMSLDVEHMVNKGTLQNDECILCGSCVDNCPKNVLKYSMKDDWNKQR